MKIVAIVISRHYFMSIKNAPSLINAKKPLSTSSIMRKCGEIVWHLLMPIYIKNRAHFHCLDNKSPLSLSIIAGVMLASADVRIMTLTSTRHFQWPAAAPPRSKHSAGQQSFIQWKWSLCRLYHAIPTWRLRLSTDEIYLYQNMRREIDMFNRNINVADADIMKNSGAAVFGQESGMKNHYSSIAQVTQSCLYRFRWGCRDYNLLSLLIGISSVFPSFNADDFWSWHADADCCAYWFYFCR